METKNKLERSVGAWSLFIFTLPTILSNVFMGIYGVVDGVFAANYIGTDALSCVNICMPLVLLALLIGIMFGTGGNALIAKKLGEGKDQEAKEDFSLIVLAGVVISIIISALCCAFRVPLLRFLGADQSLMSGCLEYMLPIVLLIPLNIPGFIFEMIIITVGKPKLGLVASVAGGVINIFLDWLFIAHYQWGLTGAALATVLGYFVPSLMGIIYFTFNRNLSLYLIKPKWRPRSIIKSCTNGASEMVSVLAMSVVTIVLNNVLMRISGPDGVAAVTVILYVQDMLISVSRGYSVGISPIVSYNYGKRDLGKLRKSCKSGILTIAIVSALMTAICMIWSAPLVRIFATDDSAPSVYEMATEGFGIFAVSMLFSGINILASALFTALNDGKTSAILSFARTFIFMIIPVLVLPIFFGMKGVWYSFPVAELLAFIMSVWYMSRLKDDGRIYKNAF